MKPFKKLTLSNYRCYQSESFDLSKNITILHGESDNGKSTVIKALLAIINNEINNEDIMHGENITTLKLTLEDDWVVIREKSLTGINRYIINTPDGKEYERYDNFGINIPSKVNIALGKDSIEVLDEINVTLNFSEQLKLSMVLALKDFQLAKMIDELSNISIFNKSIEKANTEIAKNQHERSVLFKQREQLKEKINILIPVIELEKKQKKIKKQFSLLNANKIKLMKLEKLLIQKEKLENSIIVENNIIKTLKPLEDVNIKLKSLKNKNIEYENLKKLYKELNEIKDKKNNLTKNNDILKKIRIVNIVKLEEKEITRKKLENLYNKKNNIEKNLEKNIKRLKEKNKLELILDEIKTLEMKRIKYSNLFKLYNKYEIINKQLKNSNLILKKLSNLKEISFKLVQLDEKKEEFVTYYQLNKKKNKLNQELESNKKELNKALEKYNNLKEIYRSKLKEVKYCPICNSPINENHIEKILKNI